MDEETPQDAVRKPKRKLFTSDIRVRLRESQRAELDVLGSAFGMDISEMVRDAVSQWLGRQKTDYPDLFRNTGVN